MSTKIINKKFESRNQFGFTLIELIVAAGITVILTSVMTVNFRELRYGQQLQSTTNNIVSKFREIQTFVLSGRIAASNEAANWYDVVLVSNSNSFNIQFATKNTSTTTLEVFTLEPDLRIQQVYVNGSPVSQSRVRFESPFANIIESGQRHRTIRVDVFHSRTNKTRSVIIDGISGRVGLQ